MRSRCDASLRRLSGNKEEGALNRRHQLQPTAGAKMPTTSRTAIMNPNTARMTITAWLRRVAARSEDSSDSNSIRVNLLKSLAMRSPPGVRLVCLDPAPGTS